MQVTMVSDRLGRGQSKEEKAKPASPKEPRSKALNKGRRKVRSKLKSNKHGATNTSIAALKVLQNAIDNGIVK